MAGSGLPLFPFGTAPELDAEPEHARLRREDPVPRVRLAPGGQAYLATRYDDVRRVFADPAFSRYAASEPGAAVLRPAKRNPYILLGMDPPQHTRVRRLIAQAFTTRSVQLLRPRVERLVDDLIDAMVRHGPPADFVAAFAEPLPAVVVCELMGMPAADHRMLHRLMNYSLSLSHPPQQIRAAFAELLGYLEHLVAAKRAAPGNDLLTAMITARDAGDRLSEPELVNNVYLLLFGGFETTANLLASAVLTLHRHPGQLALLRGQPDLIPDAVEELLRFVRISVASTERITLRDVELSGATIPARSTVIPLNYSANRDETLTADPDRFDITRTPAPHLAFAHGPHYCIGAPLARLELQAALAGLLRRLPAIRPALDATEVTWKQAVISRGPAALPVTW